MSSIRVISGDGRRQQDVAGDLCEAIKELVYSFARDREIPTAMAVGVLEIAKYEILRDEGDMG